MDYEQIASFQPALSELLKSFRHCFKREKTFGHWLSSRIAMSFLESQTKNEIPIV